jgi:hypothetical protein
MVLNALKGSFAVPGFGNDFQRWVSHEDVAETFGKDGMIVGNDNTNLAHRPAPCVSSEM